MNKIIISPQNLGTTPPLEYIEAARESGYDGIGIRLYRAPGRTYNFNPIVGDPALMRDVKSAIASSGMEMWDIFSFYLQPEMEWNLIEPALEYAGELGAKYALVIGDDPDWSRMCDSFGRFCDLIAPSGMSAVIEATVNALTPLSMAVLCFADAGIAYAGVCMDPCQSYRDEHSFVALRGQDPKLFPYTQLNDTTVIGRMGALPGDGLIPLGEFMDVMPADIPLSLEAGLPRDSNYTGAQWAKMSIDRTRRFLDEYYAAKAVA